MIGLLDCGGMEEPRVVELPAYHVVKLRYEGPPPPAPAFFEHWDRLNEWAAQYGVESAVEDVWAIGYRPPGPPGADSFYRAETVVYDACIPVDAGFTPEGLPGLELAALPGGPFVLCAGEITEMPFLYREAKRLAMSRGLAIERGGIELFRPHPDESDVHPVAAGYRIHD